MTLKKNKPKTKTKNSGNLLSYKKSKALRTNQLAFSVRSTTEERAVSEANLKWLDGRGVCALSCQELST